MDSTLPGKSLDSQFDAMWQRFQRLSHTRDTMMTLSNRLRRWLTPINVSFVIGIEDRAVCSYLMDAQEALIKHMDYAPQPEDKLHVTVYQVGYLRTGLALPGTWTQAQLHEIAALARQNLAYIDPFDVWVGPFNAFPNVAIAEVRDEGNIRLVRAAVSQAVPRLARPLPTYPLIPHITLGYFGRKPATPIQNVLRALRSRPPIKLHIEAVELTIYYRNPGPHEPAQALNHSTEEVLEVLPIGSAQ
jgi:2'-5' RNA ligase